MSDEIYTTGLALPSYCSSCFPDLDTRGFIEAPCHEHQPEIPKGIDDALVTSDGYLGGSGEAGGSTNAAFCRLIHGGKR